MLDLYKVLLPSAMFWLSSILFPIICLLIHYSAK